jgi:cell division initiation protein
MSPTPIEIMTVELRRAWFGGYRRQPVNELLDEVADSFGAALRERDALAARLEAMEVEAAGQRELETLLKSTLVSAERAAQEARAQARRESDLIVQEAHAESRRVTREAAAERRRLEEEIIAIQARLRAALETLGGVVAAPPAKEETEEPAPAELAETLGSGIREVVA